jgi:hypothetical protein
LHRRKAQAAASETPLAVDFTNRGKIFAEGFIPKIFFIQKIGKRKDQNLVQGDVTPNKHGPFISRSPQVINDTRKKNTLPAVPKKKNPDIQKRKRKRDRYVTPSIHKLQSLLIVPKKREKCQNKSEMEYSVGLLMRSCRNGPSIKEGKSPIYANQKHLIAVAALPPFP